MKDERHGFWFDFCIATKKGRTLCSFISKSSVLLVCPTLKRTNTFDQSKSGHHRCNVEFTSLLSRLKLQVAFYMEANNLSTLESKLLVEQSWSECCNYYFQLLTCHFFCCLRNHPMTKLHSLQPATCHKRQGSTFNYGINEEWAKVAQMIKSGCRRI